MGVGCGFAIAATIVMKRDCSAGGQLAGMEQLLQISQEKYFEICK